MKLYLFQSGTIRTKKHLLVQGPVTNEVFEVPIPFFLIVHPKGNVLFDTGQPRDAEATSAGDYISVMTEKDYVTAQLAEIGLKPTDIHYVILSHLHADHAGGLGEFSHVIGYIQQAEVDFAQNRQFIQQHPLQWRLLKGQNDDDHDVFGDGIIRIVFTPGHTPGHQSLLLTLENTGPMLLTADSIYTEDILNGNVLPAVFDDRQSTVQTIEKIRNMRRSGVKIITGHDPQAWTKFKKAPEYYE